LAVFFWTKALPQIIVPGTMNTEHTHPKSSSHPEYQKLWDQLLAYERKGLPKSANEIAEKIYTKAKAENNQGEEIKAIIHKLKYIKHQEEEGDVVAIEQLQKQIEEEKSPVRQILHSMLAELFWRYYENNRYRFYGRSVSSNSSSEDIRTWDLTKLVAEVIKQHQLALQEPDKLKTITIDLFDEILVEGKEGRAFRPTLYDFLAHRAIDFFSKQEASITKPAEQFLLKEEFYFAPSEKFASTNFTTTDSLSFKFYAIKLFQDLIKFHQTDSNPSALADVDLKRLDFVFQHSIHPDKRKLFFQSLEEFEKRYSNNPISTEASFKIASYLLGESSSYKPFVAEEHKWDAKKALAICEAAIKKFPTSLGAQNCQNLIHKIEQKKFSLKIEQIAIPDQPFKSLVTYKNVTKLFFRIIKTDFKEHAKLNEDADHYYDRHKSWKSPDEILIDHYAKKSPTHTFSIELPNDGDFQLHSTEIKFPPLPSGYYVIMAGSNEKMKYEKNGVCYGFMNVSNITLINRTLDNHDIELYVLNRRTGDPILDAEVTIKSKSYDYSTSEYVIKNLGTLKPDSHGYLLIKAEEEQRNLQFDIKSGKEFLSTEGLATEYGDYYELDQYNKFEVNNHAEDKISYLFTDRAIYRPGQTIYFKGLIIQPKDSKNYQVVSKEKITVSLYDVNGQVVSSSDFTSNEFGSYHGSFTAPSNGLTGSMRISDNYGNVYFSVEEYKRPKFEVKVEKVKESFRLNEQVVVHGSAKSYSGANLDGAEVKYRVVRETHFPRWWFASKIVYPYGSPSEVINGTTRTNEKGEFTVDFKAISDLSVPMESKPYFSFTIYADVTDINGETHSATSSLQVGYTSMLLNLEIPPFIDKQKADSLILKATNLDGEKINASGTFEIYELKSPDKIYRERLWERPDKHVLTKEEFEKAFPNDPYEDEGNYLNWTRLSKVEEGTFNTEKSDKLILDKIHNWKEGRYVIELKAKDRFGEEVKDIKYFTIIDTHSTVLPYPIAALHIESGSKAEPGESTFNIFGSSYENVSALYEIEVENQIVSRKYISLNNNLRQIKEQIKEAFRGNVTLHFSFLKDNRFYNYSHTIEVPYSNKELDIEFETFRNKLQPGEKEQWKLKIKGKNGEKVAAEMLATLYDASLDAFRRQEWSLPLYRSFYSSIHWNTIFTGISANGSNCYGHDWNKEINFKSKSYDELNWFEYYNYYNRGGVPKELLRASKKSEMNKFDLKASVSNNASDTSLALDGGGITLNFGNIQSNAAEDLISIQARKDFNETAFFYPNLETDADGSIIISFTIPEALTKWKMLGLAHTKDLQYGLIQKELITQKELMVTPNVPRFLREGDQVTITGKVNNLSNNDLTGSAMLLLFDALTMKPIDHELANNSSVQNMSIKTGLSTVVNWNITIPKNIQAVTYRMVAKAGNFTDGEENTLPVLSNRTLVTESLPLWIKSKETKTFSLDKLINNHSQTLTNQKLTLEFTSNPAWYAIQALPYLMEFPYECAEQIFSRFYSNSIATHIVTSDPKIKKVFETWKNIQPDALLSNLEKNQELKGLLLEETPWVREAKGESERKRRLALLFDLNKMSNDLNKALDKLIKMQKENGAWVWFEGMPEDRYITQHIITGLGHLDHLKVKSIRDNGQVWNMCLNGIHYLDKQIKKDYEDLKKLEAQSNFKLKDHHLSPIQIQYLYARSFFPDVKLPKESEEAVNYFKDQARSYWLNFNRYLQGMIALASSRNEDTQTASDIIKSLREFALHSEELGMYWKEEWSYFWYQAPVETQALMIELFHEVAKDQQAVDELRVWLLKQKETNDWKTTKATTEACYALLVTGTEWLSTDVKTEIKIGNAPLTIDKTSVEAGTGYFKTSWTGSEIKNEMGKVTITKPDEGISWGGLYWQYFEELDKITTHETPLKLKRQLFLEKSSANGPIIVPMTEKTNLNPGDLIKVRIELRVDRPMEYVHMKDMRASGLEPVNILSQYKYQDGLGYYESTRDASTNFFFNYLPKGTYVFEYPLRVNLNGNFSNGITTIQCMYAPQFSSHSEGIRIKIGE